jgi:hypothetical protein
MPRQTDDEYDAHDDDRGEPRPRRRPRPQAGGGSSSTKLILILVAVLGGVFLLCCGGVVALWVFRVGGGPEGWRQAQAEQARAAWKQQEAAATSEQQKAKALVDYWVALVRIGELDEAYRQTTPAFRSRMTRADFEEFVQSNRDLKTDRPGWSYGLNGRPETRFTFLLSRPKNAPYWLTAAREGDEWKLDEVGVK